MNDHADNVSVGFTGTQQGMTDEQKASVRLLLLHFSSEEFHHGGCIGADIEAAKMAREMGYTTIRWPGDTPDKQGAFVDDEIRDEMPNLVRNHAIVDEVSVMIATPGEVKEKLRSGTWATIRYARKANRKTLVVRPDGVVVGDG